MAQNDSGIPAYITNSSSSAVTMRQGSARACVDVSGVAPTTSATLAAANANRIGIFIQNIGVNNIGVNEFGGTAAVGSPGTFTVGPGAVFLVRTNRLITVISQTVPTPFTATEF